ncbi:hypothetical protein KI743_12645 [Vibrio sp. D420a]|uniref:hypothetical protein n=1 Tax=Vibrio sp. D420a TaxID=2836895 RepID=UPI002553AC6E|nr:hypothetical protein [Vibrio sp. D420a]MDK9762853.1 hypothetical protein [Vibrio sp. D420a]
MFEYKGDRNYLHGTDFYKFSAEYGEKNFSSSAYVEQLSFRQIARCQSEITHSKPSSGNIVSTGKFMLPNGEVQPFWWVETEAQVAGRYEFDEDGLVSTAIIDEETKTISMNHVSDNYSCIEEVVALNKKLNNTVKKPENGKWLFGQLHLSKKLPVVYKNIEIKLDVMLHNKFSVSDIWLDGVHFGQIRFIVGRT